MFSVVFLEIGMDKVSTQDAPFGTGSVTRSDATADAARPRPAGVPMLGGIAAGVVASLCCIGPLVLVMLGVGGAWASDLTLLTPLRPAFIGITLLFLALAAKKLFFAPRVCESGTPCADPRNIRRQRVVFVIVAVALAAMLAFPLYAHWFY